LEQNIAVEKKLEGIKSVIDGLYDSFNTFNNQMLKVRKDQQERLKGFENKIVTKVELQQALNDLKLLMTDNNKQVQEFVSKQKNEVDKLLGKFDSLSKVYDEKLKKLEEAKTSIDATFGQAQKEESDIKNKIINHLGELAQELKHKSAWGWWVIILVIQVYCFEFF
jgi:TolA-binding protein